MHDVSRESNVREITTFSDGTKCFYSQGFFDKWCVKITTSESEKIVAPKDISYFRKLKYLCDKYSVKRIYQECFLAIYHAACNDHPDDGILAFIKHKAATLEDPDDRLMCEKTLTLLYATMIAEENKLNAPSGKRMKRLVLEEILYFRIDLDLAVNKWKGKSFTEVNAACEKLGF